MDKREFSLKLYRISKNKLYYLVTAYSQTDAMYYQTAIDLIRNTFSKKNKNISYQESLFGEEYEKHN
ncbi:hypothetical protein RM023_09510 [Limosilactobacillus reuteri]|uniref:hypothetical protein n=1 Tax=Limosilactobacillus reuteri TaxID=1598 RepID=UPI0039BFDDC7